MNLRTIFCLCFAVSLVVDCPSADGDERCSMRMINRKRKGTRLAPEVEAFLMAPDRSEPRGLRDAAILECLYSSGMRVSEVVSLNRDDLPDSGDSLRVLGKGRKERCTPLRRDTAKLLAAWIGDNAADSKPLFPSIRGERLSRDALEHLVRKHCLTASRACPSRSPGSSSGRA